jgi:RNA polymerase sporulation-specific sigma factor
MKKLTQEEINLLVVQAKNGDTEAYDSLFNQFRRAMWMVVNRYVKADDKEDHFQMASIAFMRTVEKFDASKGFTFMTYMCANIEGDLRRYNRDWQNVSGPKYHRDALTYRQKVRKILAKNQWMDMEEAMQVAEVPDELKDEVESALMLSKSIHMTISTNHKGGKKETELQEVNEFVIDNSFGSRILDIDLEKLLDQREMNIFNYRFQLGLSQTEVSKLLGISQVQVSRNELKMKKKIVEYLGVKVDNLTTKSKGYDAKIKHVVTA